MTLPKLSRDAESMTIREALSIVDAYGLWLADDREDVPHPGHSNVAAAAQVLAETVRAVQRVDP